MPLRPFAFLFPFSNLCLVFDLSLNLVHVFLIFFRALFHIPSYISDGYHLPPSCRHPTSVYPTCTLTPSSWAGRPCTTCRTQTPPPLGIPSTPPPPSLGCAAISPYPTHPSSHPLFPSSRLAVARPRPCTTNFRRIRQVFGSCLVRSRWLTPV